MLDDNEVRYLAVDLLKAETTRDQQRRVGASNLSNGCDYHLAADLTGMNRSTSFSDRPYGGRVIGTAIHELLEERFNQALQDARTSIAQRFPDAQIEKKYCIGELGSYGPVYSTADWYLPLQRHLGDWKNTENAKAAVTLDAWQLMQGLEPRYGRKHAAHKAKPLSESAYAEAIAKAEYKLTGYYTQTSLYARGKILQGFEVDAMSIVLISRDSTMWFDNPAADGWDNPDKLRGVNVITFPYDQDFADAAWQRGIDIWNALQDGAQIEDFKRHPLCFSCSTEREHEAPALDNVVSIGGKVAA